MSITPAQVETFFRDFGLFVRMANLYGSDVPALIAAESVLKRTQLGSDDERLALLGDAIALDNQNTVQITSMVDGEVQLVDGYVTGYVKDTIQGQGDSATEVLEDLAEQMTENCTPAQYVLQNEVAAGAATADEDNEGNGTLGSITVSQYLTEQRFTVECIDATTEGSEVWSVTGSVLGQLGDNATTGVAYTDTDTQLAFTIIAGASAFKSGDKFTFYVTCTERLFQTFFRDHFGVVFPAVASGSETIEESWAA